MGVVASEAFSAEISVTSPQQIFILLIKTYKHRVEVEASKNTYIFIFENVVLAVGMTLHEELRSSEKVGTSASFLAELSVRSPRKLIIFII